MTRAPLAAGEKPQRPDTGQEEVRAAANRGERRQTAKPLANRPLGNRHVERAVVGADDRVSLVVEVLELRIVDPDVHREFELANQAGTADERGDAALHAVVRRALRQRRAVGAAAADHLAALHVLGGVARVHAPDVRADRAAIAVRVGILVQKVVGPLQIAAERRIVLVRAEHQRRAAAPPSHQLRRQQFLLVRRLRLLPQELAERADVLLHAQVGEIAAIARQDLRLRQRRRRSALVVVAEEELAGLHRRSGARRRLLAGSRDDRLRQAVAVAEMLARDAVERRAALRGSSAESTVTPVSVDR